MSGAAFIPGCELENSGSIVIHSKPADVVRCVCLAKHDLVCLLEEEYSLLSALFTSLQISLCSQVPSNNTVSLRCLFPPLTAA